MDITGKYPFKIRLDFANDPNEYIGFKGLMYDVLLI